MNLKDPKAIIIGSVIVILVAVLGFVILSQSSDEPAKSNLTPVVESEDINYESLYNDISETLNVNQEDLVSFVFFDDDKVVYQDSPQITQAYNDGSGWKIAYQGTSAPSCEEVSDQPEGYKVACGTNPETGEVIEQGDWDVENPNYYNYFINEIQEPVNQNPDVNEEIVN